VYRLPLSLVVTVKAWKMLPACLPACLVLYTLGLCVVLSLYSGFASLYSNAT